MYAAYVCFGYNDNKRYRDKSLKPKQFKSEQAAEKFAYRMLDKYKGLSVWVSVEAEYPLSGETLYVLD